MIKNIIAKLVNWQAQRDNNAEKIHGSEQKDSNKQKAEIAKEREHELRDEMKKREEPSEAQILGPSDSKEA